ncbi:MAG: glucose 1-dehydrogenase [Armatimonadota bacterium]|nr:glucose 1-dehydrogenase [Armatimonadota bacterium]MDR7451536.1 glucose 1-dehydrogenase [Armatimonadota bacterium]MDR7467503.1 glucose 1-dehydrogenase [Armatimonadota bacterium]MDR7494377.1 glucose 1-dehydrogenase [Armatimonadota bacterium]MDR7499194.1 glucose 1-dehydrogenase [Armatimonadota bacterium]
MDFGGKVAVITGAGAGIGRATAVLFARAGARVAVVDVDAGAGPQTVEQIAASGGEAVFIAADVSNPDDVRRMVETVMARFGRLDILVNNAGIYLQGDVLATSEADWRRLLEVNLTGPFLCAKYCIPAMRAHGGGVIVNVASEAGLVGIKGQVAYNVSKAGVIGLTRSLAVDGAPEIRVNCICPGTTDTPLVAASLRRQRDPAAARRALETVRPAGRLGRPEEIAFGILCLAADELHYATGAILSVDGGYTAQ